MKNIDLVIFIACLCAASLILGMEIGKWAYKIDHQLVCAETRS